MNATDPEFILRLTDLQGRLFGYLVTILGNAHDARDVLQETNLVLCRKADSFNDKTDFGAWSRSVAHFQALAFLRDRKRERHALDPEMLTLFAEQVSQEPPEDESTRRELALRECLASLPGTHRQLVRRHYEDRRTLRKIAKEEDKKESAIRMKMMRIRQALLSCIENRLKEELA